MTERVTLTLTSHLNLVCESRVGFGSFTHILVDFKPGYLYVVSNFSGR